MDELPQLFNVLRGDMSLVGPRPEQPALAEEFQKTIPDYGKRHRMRPGITGWAQVNGLRGDTNVEERTAYDLQYINNWSPTLDAYILLRTLCGGMINRIDVYETEGTGKNRTQRVVIHYRFVGYIELPDGIFKCSHQADTRQGVRVNYLRSPVTA